MPDRGPRYSDKEFVCRGDAMYEKDGCPHLKPEDENKFVAIDIETGAYELDPDDYTATERLLARNPDAQIWLVRVGQPTAYHVGLMPVGVAINGPNVIEER
jgi:hypothetical protein